jgi:peptidyl-prolyl cis-trans isomerase C
MILENLTRRAAARASGRIMVTVPVLAAFAVMALALVPQARAQEEPSSKVVATVNGSPITEADVAFTAIDLAPTLEQYSPEQRTRILMDLLINQKLMAEAAQKDGIQDSKEFMQRMALMRERTLRDFYFNEKVQKSISDEAVKQSYEQQAAEIAAEEEVRARHILVKTKEEAEAIIKEIEGGAEFEKLAGEKSIGPSKANGGDLGYLSKDDVVEPFGTAVMALETGKISEPVQTEFGWHVIRVDDKRKKSAPPFEAMEGEIRQGLLRERFLALVNELKEGAKIDVVGEEAGDGKAGEGEAPQPEAGQDKQKSE